MKKAPTKAMDSKRKTTKRGPKQLYMYQEINFINLKNIQKLKLRAKKPKLSNFEQMKNIDKTKKMKKTKPQNQQPLTKKTTKRKPPKTK